MAWLARMLRRIAGRSEPGTGPLEQRLARLGAGVELPRLRRTRLLFRKPVSPRADAAPR
jgi:hypothetical protein